MSMKKRNLRKSSKNKKAHSEKVNQVLEVVNRTEDLKIRNLRDLLRKTNTT